MTFPRTRLIQVHSTSHGLASRATFAGWILVLGLVLSAPAYGQGMWTGDEDIGFRTRVGHITGETVGRLESLTHFEFMPYMRTQDGLLFFDARAFTSDGEIGVNAGVGYRQLVPDLNRAFGAIVWYDRDELSGTPATQITVSLESYGPIVDVLGNIYIPIGDDDTGSLTTSNARFAGDQLLFDQSGTVGSVLGGGDIQVGALLPGQFAQENQIRAFAGAYHYSGNNVEDVSGFLARIEGSFLDLFDAQVKLTNDDVFGTNVIFGISVGISAGRTPEWGRVSADSLMRYPTRQYNAVVTRNEVNETGVAAINPDTGNAYSFSHTFSGAAGARTGAAESPFNSLSDALASSADFNIVHGNSVFGGADAVVALSEGQRLIGLSDGITRELEVKGVGPLALPTTSGSAAPILRDTAGDLSLIHI